MITLIRKPLFVFSLIFPLLSLITCSWSHSLSTKNPPAITIESSTKLPLPEVTFLTYTPKMSNTKPRLIDKWADISNYEIIDVLYQNNEQVFFKLEKEGKYFWSQEISLSYKPMAETNISVYSNGIWSSPMGSQLSNNSEQFFLKTVNKEDKFISNSKLCGDTRYFGETPETINWFSKDQYITMTCAPEYGNAFTTIIDTKNSYIFNIDSPFYKYGPLGVNSRISNNGKYLFFSTMGGCHFIISFDDLYHISSIAKKDDLPIDGVIGNPIVESPNATVPICKSDADYIYPVFDESSENLYVWKKTYDKLKSFENGLYVYNISTRSLRKIEILSNEETNIELAHWLINIESFFNVKWVFFEKEQKIILLRFLGNKTQYLEIPYKYEK